MYKSIAYVLVAGLLSAGTASAQNKNPGQVPTQTPPKAPTAPPTQAQMQHVSSANSKYFTGSIQMGYYNGMTVHMSATFDNFSDGFPLALRLGYGCTWADPGDALMARRVFINNNTNGVARGSGKNWDLRFDVMHDIKLFSLQQSRLFGGVRRNDYTGYFEYIGGAETFSVNGNQWGLGGGLETGFALSPLVNLTVSLGADYFFKSELNGHDTYYRPDGTATNQIANYTYKDADEAINQPDFQIRTLFGISYKF